VSFVLQVNLEVNVNYVNNGKQKRKKIFYFFLNFVLVFGERDGRLKGGAAELARERGLAVGVGALVATQVRELRVGLGADLALVRLDAAVDVHVLLEAAGRGERFRARGTGERAELGVTAA
jgi:hypothetical protein